MLEETHIPTPNRKRHVLDIAFTLVVTLKSPSFGINFEFNNKKSIEHLGHYHLLLARPFKIGVSLQIGC